MTNVKLYTVKEADKLVGVSTNTLYKYLDEDRIHAARGSAIQGRFRIPETALEEFLGVKLSSPDTDTTDTLTNRVTESPISQDSPLLQPTTYNLQPSPKLPLKLARFLLILALLSVLLDLIIARSVSLPAQFSRLFFLLCMLILAYQEGGYRRG